MNRRASLTTFCLILTSTLVSSVSRSPVAQSNLSNSPKFPTAEEFKVTEVVLKADDGRSSGPCPVRVTFIGYITANGPGAIKYTFTRSDGAPGPVHIMEFKEAGTQEVMTDWTLGDPRLRPRYTGWQAVKVLSPVEIESNHETGSFEIDCAGPPDKPKIPNQPREIARQSSEIQYWLSSYPIPFGPHQTVRLELKNLGNKTIPVRIQLVDKDGKVLIERDQIMSWQSAPVVMSFDGMTDERANPKGPHAGDSNTEQGFPTGSRVQIGTMEARSLLLLQPTLRILEQGSGNEVLKVEPNGFTKAELGPPVVQPDAPRKGGSELATAYERMLSQITAPNLARFNSDFNKLKSLNEDLASRLDRAPKSANFDKQKLQDEFKTILKEKDRTKLDRDIAEFRDRYEQQFMEELNAAGIDVNTERQRAASLIGLNQQQVTPEAYLNARRMLAVGSVTEFVDDRPPVEAAPLFYEDAFASPFTAAGSRAPGSANNRDGTLRSWVYAPLLNFESRLQHNNVFVVQVMTTRPGARRLHVSASINDLVVYMTAHALGGWASAEFAITLRVFDGERVVATRRVPVERFASTVVGFNTLNRRFPALTIGCEFERSSTAGAENYSLVVEFETLANSFGIAHATSDASGRVGPFTVRTY